MNGFSTLGDEEVMRLVRDGDTRAFEVLYDRHATAAFSLAYRIAGLRGVAEDAVQEAFLSIWRSRERYDAERGSVRTWVLSVVHRRAIDAVRRSQVHDRRRGSAEGLEETREAPERTDVEVARREQAAEVRAAIDGLPVEQSRVIELAYYGGFSQTEIADLVDAPLGTIKGRMRLGLEKMRQGLSDGTVA